MSDLPGSKKSIHHPLEEYDWEEKQDLLSPTLKLSYLAPGTMLNDRYFIDKKLGEGGMGEVFKAFDSKKKNRAVAIKRLLDSDPVVRKRFMREYRFLKAVSHENLVRAYDYFRQNNDLFMVLEFVQGKSMADILKEESKPFSLAEQIAIANKTARAVELLNTGGILHRDIKPDNIIIDESSGKVKLIDLGVGKNVKQENKTQALTLENAVVGSLAYISPEQIKGISDERSDVFSLGVTLYQFFLWLPESPYFAKNQMGMLWKIDRYNPPLLYEEILKSQPNMDPQEEEIYKELSEILHKAQEKEPEKRLVSSKLLADKCEELHKKIDPIKDRKCSKQYTYPKNWKKTYSRNYRK